MTGEHVQDLLIDLAYGELPPDRAAEVEAHLASCEACRAERDELARTRTLVAPLRSLEEPGPGFDERILKSARAEAGLQADGTPGPTIEVSGSLKPLGLQAARVDPLAPGVRVARKEPSRRAVWLKRAAVGASIAGAAGVALIVATSIRPRALLRTAEVDELKIRAPVLPAPAGTVPQDQARAAHGSGGDLAQVPTAFKPRREPEAAPPVPQSKAEERAAPPPQVRQEGQMRRKLKSPAPPERLEREPTAAGGLASAPAAAAPAERARGNDAFAADEASTPRPAPESKERKQEPAPAKKDQLVALGGRAPVSSPAAPPATDLQKAASTRENPDPDRLEESAGEARRSGQYPRAAELYKLAAGIRRSRNDTSRAAWDLAHAVECLAAASKLTEAGDVRAELLRSFPSEEGPLHAADRALGWPAKTKP